MKRLINLLLIIILFAGCATAKYRIWYELETSTPSPQTLNDVTIDVQYLGPEKAQTHPALQIPRKELPGGVKGSWTAISREKKGMVWVYPFKGMVAFYVKITNNTAHILRMGDARIFLVIEEETYPALTRNQLTAMLTKEDGSPTLESAFIAHRKTKLINDLATEILPDFSTKGFIAFEVPPEVVAGKGSLSFFDVTTKVDKAGNPIEKTKFTFKIVRHITQLQ